MIFRESRHCSSSCWSWSVSRVQNGDQKSWILLFIWVGFVIQLSCLMVLMFITYLMAFQLLSHRFHRNYLVSTSLIQILSSIRIECLLSTFNLVAVFDLDLTVLQHKIDLKLLVDGRVHRLLDYEYEKFSSEFLEICSNFFFKFHFTEWIMSIINFLAIFLDHLKDFLNIFGCWYSRIPLQSLGTKSITEKIHKLYPFAFVMAFHSECTWFWRLFELELPKLAAKKFGFYVPVSFFALLGIIFHQLRLFWDLDFPEITGDFPSKKLHFGGDRSCEVAIIWPDPTFNRNPYNGYINPYYWVEFPIPYNMEIMGV